MSIQRQHYNLGLGDWCLFYDCLCLQLQSCCLNSLSTDFRAFVVQLKRYGANSGFLSHVSRFFWWGLKEAPFSHDWILLSPFVKTVSHRLHLLFDPSSQPFWLSKVSKTSLTNQLRLWSQSLNCYAIRKTFMTRINSMVHLLVSCLTSFLI